MFLFLFIFSGLATWCLLKLLIPFLSRSFLDQITHRSSHIKPTPRGGGLSFVLVALAASIISFFFLPEAYVSNPTFVLIPVWVFPIAIIGFLDDYYDLPAVLRLCLQIFISLLIVLVSPLFSFSLFGLPLCIFLVFCCTAIINFINFMDGVDGLVAGGMAVALLPVVFILSAPISIWVLIGALIGFLVCNWSPSEVFMGDVGSTYLGAVYAALLLHSNSWIQSISFLLVLTPLLGDSFFCVVRRFFAGHSPLQAHRLHLYQRLHQAGWSHARVSSLYIAATAVLAIALLLGGLPWVIPLVLLEVLIGIWLDQYVAVPFVVASRS